jgi:hypothetical protein
MKHTHTAILFLFVLATSLLSIEMLTGVFLSEDASSISLTLESEGKELLEVKELMEDEVCSIRKASESQAQQRLKFLSDKVSAYDSNDVSPPDIPPEG